MKRSLCLAVLASVVVLLLAAPAALAQDGDLSCSAFANQETAQAILEGNPADIYDLDTNGNGIPCEDAGDGTAEDGTLAPFAAGAQYSAAPETLAETGGPTLLVPVLLGAALLAACVAGLFLVARRAWRASDPGGEQHAAMELGPNAGRILAVVAAAALAILLSILLGAGAFGPAEEAEAQGFNPLRLTTSVHPSPTDAIALGTRMDFLITEENLTNGNRSARNVTVYEALPAGVRYISATPSQGSCAPMADEPTIVCELGTIRAGGVAHVNVVVEAVRTGTHTNNVSDSLNNTASARFTIVRRLLSSVAAGGASIRTCPDGTSVIAGGASITTGTGC